MKLPPKREELSLLERAALYLRKCPISVSGQNGHDRLFYAACQMVLGFELPAEDALTLLKTEYNPKCSPPWSHSDLAYKVAQAAKQEGPRGYLVGEAGGGSTRQQSTGTEKQPKPPEFDSPLGILGDLMGRLRSGEGDVLFDVPGIFQGFEVGPKKLTILGAPPGFGKTALVMQYLFSLLGHNSELTVILANAEMPFETLLMRELTRRSNVPAKALRFADLSPGQLDAVERSATELVPLIERIRPMQPPFDCAALGSLLTADPGLLLVDYLQKFASGDDPRTATNEVVGTLRSLAHVGWAVLALSATTRGKHGHKSDDLSMSSFKESGEIEFNADAAYLLRDEGPSGSNEHVRLVSLDCVKNRHGEQSKAEMIFDKPHMTFALAEKHDFGEYGRDDL